MSVPLPPSDCYPVPAGEASAEQTVQRSRFLALAFPVTDRDQANSALGRIRTLHHKATHHCSALLLGHPLHGEGWSSDDGEPSGSAGAPMLKEIRGAGLGDVMVVCVRWFGGVKLGTGGLVRAYGETTRLALGDLPRGQRVLTATVGVRLPWSAMTRAKRLLVEYHAVETAAHPGADADLELAVPRSLAEPFRAALRELLQGAGEVR